MTKDTLLTFHEFAHQVAAALNTANITPCGGQDDLCAVMVIVGAPSEDSPPLGGSLNYDREAKTWGVELQIESPRRVS